MNVFVRMSLLQMALTSGFNNCDINVNISQNSSQKHVAKVNTYPHHVLIAYGGFYCSGALVRSQIVVTAASCFVFRSDQKVIVKVGANTVTSAGQVIPVEEIKIHEYYKHSSGADNDIALLVLKEHVAFGIRVQKIILVEPDIGLDKGASIRVTGWGHTDSASKLTHNLIWSDMVVLDQEECKTHFKSLITPSNFCAKYQTDRRLSDNGGSAVYKDLMVAILSFGGYNKVEPNVAVFTNVSYFKRWITLNCHRFQEKYCVKTTQNHSDYDYSDETDVKVRALSNSAF